MSLNHIVALGVLFLASVSAIGCGRTEKTADSKLAEADHVHGEWWCPEHGVPEEICGRCNTDLVPDFKAKGDWCDEHSRPDSQCFICHPEKQAEFAAQYEAKYGEKPPKLELEGSEHKHEHGEEGEHKQDDEHEKKA